MFKQWILLACMSWVYSISTRQSSLDSFLRLAKEGLYNNCNNITNDSSVPATAVSQRQQCPSDTQRQQCLTAVSKQQQCTSDSSVPVTLSDSSV